MKYYKDDQNKVYAYEDDTPESYFQDKTEITVEEANALAKQINQQLIDSLDYARRRQIAYPSIGDQLDALFHAGVFPESMAAQIQAVKDKYPKP